jgi:hypothetical protein
MTRVYRSTLAWAALPFLTAAIDAQASPLCPKPATQADVLNLKLAPQENVSLTGELRGAVAEVYACHPPHPVLGGPALVRFEDVRTAPHGRVLMRFRVVGLSDMRLAYLADRGGNLLQAFVTGP